jgi:hypothetical protein
MALLLHILIALSSIAFTTYVFFSPSKPKLNASYALVAATIASGTYLVFANPAHMLQSCVSGLIYLGIVTVGIVSARAKLARNA